MKKFFVSFLCSWTLLNTSLAFADVRRDAQVTLVCLSRWTCNKYKDAANACSTAGNFTTCMNVKLNGSDLSSKCEFNGSVKSDLKKILQDPEIFDISDTNCWKLYAEMKLVPLGYSPRWGDLMKKYLGNDSYWK